VIKVGQLEKQGAVRKSWKTRTFVALNEKDNYQIFYYPDKIELPDGATRDDIPKGKKPKGVIKLSGDPRPAAPPYPHAHLARTPPSPERALPTRSFPSPPIATAPAQATTSRTSR